MITDINSPAYHLAAELAIIYMTTKSQQAVTDFFEANSKGFKLWEVMAIRDTFQTLIKERGLV